MERILKLLCELKEGEEINKEVLIEETNNLFLQYEKCEERFKEIEEKTSQKEIIAITRHVTESVKNDIERAKEKTEEIFKLAEEYPEYSFLLYSSLDDYLTRKFSE